MLTRIPQVVLRCKLTLLLVVFSAAWTDGGMADCVRFDINDLLSCREVTPAEFAEQNPNEKLIEVPFEISSLIQLGREDTLLQYLYVIEGTGAATRIVDYSPKTELVTNVVGNFAVQQQKETTTTVGITASGQYDPLVTADGTATRGSKSLDSVKFDVLPPLELLAASGTMARGTAAYFKLKPSRRTSLEGAKPFSLVLRVPRSWRAGYLRVRCAAYQRARSGALNQEKDTICGSASFVVALYMEGDVRAKELAFQMIYQERQLRALAKARQHALNRHRYDSLTDRLLVVLGTKEARIPDNWLHAVIASAPEADELDFAVHLPQDLRHALARYLEARQQLHALGQPDEQLARSLPPATADGTMATH